jgi:tellurite resistance protein/uncharacterized protein (DUF697 family)
MNQQDAETIVAIATLAALADGERDSSEQAQISAAATRLGLLGAEGAVQRAMSGQLGAATLAASLSGPEAKRTAYEVAVAVCHADGLLNLPETQFLRDLSASLSLDPGMAAGMMASATSASSAFSAMPSPPLSDANRSAPSSAASNTASQNSPSLSAASPTAAPGGPADLDAYILDQAILTAALELLPDRLANIGILPLQLRLVRHVGQQYGQQLDAAGIKDLAATFGIGAAAQLMESVVRRTLGGIAGGLLGGMFGGAAGVAAGGALTFASTYALGHASQQYYAQGRKLSTADLKALFTRLQGEANTIYPRVQERVTSMARSGSVESLMRSVRG